MDKIYFKKDTLIRIEHFGILLLSLDGRRFSISNTFKSIISHIDGSDISQLISKFSSELSRDKIIELIESLMGKGILTYSSKKQKSKVRIIENDFVGEDCLSFPRTVYWELTQLCNLECIHCYSNSRVKGFKGLDIQVVKKTIDELVNKGVEFLNIGGGEPLMYRYIYEVLEYAISKGLMIEITTNGILISKESLNKLKKAGVKFIQVSLDGSNKEIYEKIRKKAKFDDVIESIKSLIKEGFIVSVNTVLMEYNKDDIMNIIQLCKDLGVSYFKVSPLMETGRGSNEADNIQLSLSKYKKIYAKILGYKNKNKDKDMKIIMYQNILEPEVKNITWMPDNHFGCPAGRTTCGIDSFGNVYPCSYMNHKELSCGNINDQSLSDIRIKSEVMHNIRNISKILGKCSSCKFLNLCRGGCRAMAYLRYKRIDAEDPLCVVNNNDVL